MLYADGRHPEPGEVCTICVPSIRKRAALLYDRVYVAPDVEEPDSDDPIPPQLTIGSRQITSAVVHRLIQLVARTSQNKGPDGWTPSGNEKQDTEFIRRWVYEEAMQPIITTYKSKGTNLIPGYPVHPIYETQHSQTGDGFALEAVLSHIPVIDQAQISWEQIIDFRQDKETIRKYREFRMWLRDSLTASSPSEATELINKKLESYEWAMRKHGLATVQGALTFIFDFKKLGIAATAATAGGAIAGPIGSAFAAGVAIAGQATAWAIERKIKREETQRGPDSEVAYIYDVNSRFGK